MLYTIPTRRGKYDGETVLVDKENKYYVYLHRRGDNNEVFYIGKGCRDRAKSKHGRSEWWHRIVNKHGYNIEYFEKEISEYEAFTLEEELISFYRSVGHPLCNIASGGYGASSGVVRSEETKLKMSQAKDGKKKKVICSNGIVFDSIRLATDWCIANGVIYAKPRGIGDCCNGRGKTAYGYSWKFV